MKLNDILDTVNCVIEGIRMTKGLQVYGHLVSRLEIKKSMGPYKQAYIYIEYVNRDTGSNYNLLTASLMDKAPIDKKEEFILKAEKSALFKLIVLLHEEKIWNALIEGTYGTTEGFLHTDK